MWRKRRWDALIKILKKRPHRTGAEIGVYKGVTTSHLLARFRDIEKLYCVDVWEYRHEYEMTREEYKWRQPSDYHDAFRTFQEAIAPHRERVIPLKMSSEEAAKQVPDESLDFVFIDANHAYEFAKQDIGLWTPKVRAGGVIIGHDYKRSGEKPLWGVKRAVDEIFGDQVTLAASSVWWTLKPERP